MKYWIKVDSFHGPRWYRPYISDLVLSSTFQLDCSKSMLGFFFLLKVNKLAGGWSFSMRELKDFFLAHCE